MLQQAATDARLHGATPGATVQVTVKKWGNSMAVRIPAHVVAAAKLQLDSRVEVREENGRIVIEPVPAGSCDLAVLIAGITKDNLHVEASFGAPVGREAL